MRMNEMIHQSINQSINPKAERLAKIINSLLGQLLNTLESGDIIKFSGDAVLVLYQELAVQTPTRS